MSATKLAFTVLDQTAQIKSTGICGKSDRLALEHREHLSRSPMTDATYLDCSVCWQKFDHRAGLGYAICGDGSTTLIRGRCHTLDPGRS